MKNEKGRAREEDGRMEDGEKEEEEEDIDAGDGEERVI